MPVRVVVCGVGAVGGRAARQLASSTEVESIVVIDRDGAQAAAVAHSLGPVAEVQPWHPEVLDGTDALLVCAPISVSSGSLASGLVTGVGLEVVEGALRAGVAVVTT